MFSFSRGQIAVYLLVAGVLILVGLNSVRGGDGQGQPLSLGSEAAGAGSGGADSGLKVSAGRDRLTVDVSGGVKRPGVYRFSEGARVIDAIKRAGGVTAAAMPGAINRAAKLADGQQVVVPMRVSAGGGDGGRIPGAGAGSGMPDAPISLGTATAEQLQEIDGIGPVTASQIIEFRDSKGGLGSVEDLDQVSGIGPVTMEALRSRLQP